MATPALPNIRIPSFSGTPGSFTWSREAIDQALREDPEHLNHPDINRNRALHALLKGTFGEGFEREDLHRVHQILRLPSIDLNSGDGHHMTPLHCVVRGSLPPGETTEVLRALLEARSDPNLADFRHSGRGEWFHSRSDTPLFFALNRYRPDDLIQLLIAYGGDAVASRGDPKTTWTISLHAIELERLAAMTEAVKQQYMGPLQAHLSRDAAGIVAAYLICPKGPR